MSTPLPSIFFQSKIGAISALTFDMLNSVDPDMLFGLYIDTACFASKSLIAQAGSLCKFIGQEKRPVLLGPDNCAHPIILKSKKSSTQIQYSSNTVYSYFSVESFAELIKAINPTFFILPNPILPPTTITFKPPKVSDLLLCCNATAPWLSLSVQSSQFFIGITEEMINYSEPIPKPETYLKYLEEIKQAKGPLFLPYLSQLESVCRLRKERGYGHHIVVTSSDSLVSLLTALQYTSVSVITNIISSYSEQGIAITLPLGPFYKQLNLLENQEPALKRDFNIETLYSSTKEYTALSYLDSSKYVVDLEPLDSECQCLACKRPKAYLRHLYTTHELTGKLLVAVHNTKWLKSFLILREKCIQLYGPESLQTMVKAIIRAICKQTTDV